MWFLCAVRGFSGFGVGVGLTYLRFGAGLEAGIGERFLGLDLSLGAGLGENAIANILSSCCLEIYS